MGKNKLGTLWFQLEDTVLLIGTLLLFDPVLTCYCYLTLNTLRRYYLLEHVFYLEPEINVSSKLEVNSGELLKLKMWAMSIEW